MENGSLILNGLRTSSGNYGDEILTIRPENGVSFQGSKEDKIIKYDKNFGLDLAYYEDTTTFRQPITINKNKGYLNGSIDYMTCNDNMCIPYHYPFEIKINRPN